MGKFISNTETKGRITAVNIVIPVICTSAVMLGIERLVIFITGAGCNKIILDCLIVILSIAAAAAFEILRAKEVRWRLRLVLPAVLAIVYVLAARYVFHDNIKAFLSVCRANVLSVINEYYQVHIVYPAPEEMGAAGLAAGAAVLLFPLVVAIGFETATFLKCYVTGAVFAVLMIAVFMLGKVPPAAPTMLVLSGIIVLIPSSRERRKAVQETMVMGAAAIAAAVIAGIAGMPVVTRVWESGEDIRNNVIEYWSRIESGKSSIRIGDAFGFISSGGINDGELGQSGGFSFNGSTQLKVTVFKEPQSTIYIKGFVGSEYEGNRWGIIEDEMETVADRIGYAAYDYIYKMRNEFGIDNIRIERVSASKKYIYRPYSIKSEDYPSPGSRSYYYTFYPSKWDVNTFYQDILKNTEYEQLEKRYRVYAYEKYTQVPDTGLERFKEGFRYAPVGNFGKAYSYIYDHLRRENKYNINVGATPQDKDFIEYFLYEQKEGYCTHFASAAVMMFRMAGFPARYASGYIIPPEDFEDNGDGSYKAVVRDNRAHAWAEVYINGTGWCPVEMTPEYMDLNNPHLNLIYAGGTKEDFTMQNPIEKNPDGTTEDPEDSGDVDEEDEETEPDGSNDVSDTDETWLSSVGPAMIKLLWVLAAAACAAAAISALVMTAYMILKFITWNKLKLPKADQVLQYDYNRIIIEMFHWMYKVSLCAGIPSYIETDKPEFAGAFEEHFDNIKHGTYEEVLQIVIRANFAKDPAGREEADKVCSCCRLMLEHEERSAGFITKFRIYGIKKKWKV